jgi:S-(hydroxymethyl)glutathione dehydrogenase / alcohol dehydrogenase
VLCIDSVGFEAVGHTTGSGNGITSGGMHYHSKVLDPIYEPANPIQVLEWMYQCARKLSTLSVPGAYSSIPFRLMLNKRVASRFSNRYITNLN